MPSILDKILQQKKLEVSNLKQRMPINMENDRTQYYSFIEKMTTSKELLVISEFKRASPSKGIINELVDPVDQATTYVENGASAISVLTDASFFKGSFEDLQQIRRHVSVPILCKDFIIDEIQIDMAHAAGADMILLIAAALTENRLIELYEYATKKQLEVLIEIHDEQELAKAVQTGTKMIGVNNRNLKNFHVEIQVTEKLAPKVIAEGINLISESGLATIEDVKCVAAAGAKAVLIGEAFMKNNKRRNLIKQFSHVPLVGANK